MFLSYGSIAIAMIKCDSITVVATRNTFINRCNITKTEMLFSIFYCFFIIINIYSIINSTIKKIAHKITSNLFYKNTRWFSSDISTAVGVILLPYSNSFIETYRFQWYFIRLQNSRSEYHLDEVQISLRSNITRQRRIELALCP